MTPLPPKQGLKPFLSVRAGCAIWSYDTTSTKTRIETSLERVIRKIERRYDTTSTKTRIETAFSEVNISGQDGCYDTTSTKTRIETPRSVVPSARHACVMTPLPPKQGLKPAGERGGHCARCWL